MSEVGKKRGKKVHNTCKKKKTAGCAWLAYTLLIIWSEHKCKNISAFKEKGGYLIWQQNQ